MSEGYSLSDLLDYDNGPSFEDLKALQNEAMKHALARQREQVHGTAVAVASLFDKKVLASFSGAISSAIARIERLDMTPEQVRERTLKELKKLRQFVFDESPEDAVPPWEREAG